MLILVFLTEIHIENIDTHRKYCYEENILILFADFQAEKTNKIFQQYCDVTIYLNLTMF